MVVTMVTMASSSNDDSASNGNEEFINPFRVDGTLSVRDSATVLCVRRRRRRRSSSGSGADAVPFIQTFKEKYGERALKSPLLKTFVKDGEDVCFKGGWEVLLGQSEVVNWIRSTPDELVSMRYPGEMKVAGGHVDEGETLQEAAKRELIEEFLRPAGTTVPLDDILIRPFSVKQTRPVRARSNLMYNFVAIADENPWLANLDVNAVNEALRMRRADFHLFAGVPDSPFWTMSPEEKELHSPEVYQIQWVPLPQAMENCLTSALGTIYVNEWQRQEFKRVDRITRDPMVMTGAVLVELEIFPNVESLVKYCETVDLAELCALEQWLFHGMTGEEVAEAFRRRTDPKNQTNREPSFKPLALIKQKREHLRSMSNL